MSQVLNETRRAYAAQRGVSQGASITLAAVCGGYQARFGCATKAAEILGTRHLTDYATPPESVPTLFIPAGEVHRSITKLAETLSVALVDTVTDDNGTRFVLVWKIEARVNAMPSFDTVAARVAATGNQGDALSDGESTNPDDY